MGISGAASLAIASAILGFAVGAGLTGSALASLGAGAIVAWRAWTRPFLALEPAAASRPLKIDAAIASVAALVQLARLTVFIVNPTNRRMRGVVAEMAKVRVRRSCERPLRATSRTAS